MMRRRTASTLLLGLLASCAVKKPPIFGKQIPVLPESGVWAMGSDAPAVVLPPPTLLADWPQTLANAAHAPGNTAGPLKFAAHWTAHVGAPGGYRQPLVASPVMASGRVFAQDANGVVSAFSAADGSRVWHTKTQPKHATEKNIGGGIGYDNGRIYVSTGYGELLALDAGSGNILWRQPLDFPARTAPLIAGGLVVVTVQNDILLTFDAGTGMPGWRFTGSVGQSQAAAVAITGAPAYADGILVAGFSSGTLAAIDVNSGTALWEQSLATAYGQASSLDFSDIVASPVIADGVVYAIGLGNTAMAVDLHSGAKVWTHSAAGMQPFCLAGGFAFVLDKSDVLYAIHADDGLASWILQMPDFRKMTKHHKGKGAQSWTGPVMVDGKLLLTSSLGTVAVVDAVEGKIQGTAKLAGTADITPICANGLLLQLTRDAKLTAYG